MTTTLALMHIPALDLAVSPTVSPYLEQLRNALALLLVAESQWRFAGGTHDLWVGGNRIEGEMSHWVTHGRLETNPFQDKFAGSVLSI